MRIGLDLDGVCFELVNTFCDWHNETYETLFKKENFNSEFWVDVLGGDEELMIDKIYNFYHSDFFLKINPIKGAQTAVDKLNKFHEIVFITGRSLDFKPKTLLSIDKYFPNVSEKVRFVNHYSKNGSGFSKGKVCDDLGIHIMVDDQTSYVRDCLGNGRKVILFDQPWNQNKKIEDAVRAYSWKGVLKEIALYELSGQ